MRRTLPLLALAAALAATAGCRDVLVDPPAPVQPGPPGVASIYLKGPTTLRVSGQGNYRAEYVPGVDHYEWHAIGNGAVRLSFPAGDSRLPVVLADASGTVDLVAEAYDAAGVLLALAGKTITIR